MARAAQNQGVSTRVILQQGVLADYGVGEAAFVPFGPYPRRWQRRFDDFLARRGHARYFMSRLFAPALEAIRFDFDGHVFFHDNLDALAAFQRARPQAKIGLWLHNYTWRGREPVELKRALGAAYRIVCVSDFVAQSLLRECGQLCENLAAKVVTVLNGVDTERFKPVENRHHQASEPLVIGFAGRIIEKKGVHLLLEAAQMLASNPQTNHFKLRFIGSKSIQPGETLSPYEQQLHAQAKPLGPQVEWVGIVPRDQMPAQLAGCDIFCVPSIWEEPFGLSLLEGMASGAAVVVSRRGGIPEVARDAALYFEPPQAEALAQNLAKLIENPALLRESQQKSRERALELTWAHSFASLRDQVL